LQSCVEVLEARDTDFLDSMSLWLANCYFAMIPQGSSSFCGIAIVKELEWKDAELYQTRMIKSGTTWRSAKKLLKELAWASSFRQRMPLLERMDRQSNPSQFGDGCKCLILEREMAEARGGSLGRW
jgi:hypothetical protein